MILMVRLWSAIFLALLGVDMLMSSNQGEKFVGAAIGAVGLAALFVVWRGRPAS